MAQTKSVKDRGAFLTAMLVLAAFGTISSVYTLTNSSNLVLAYGVLPNWFYPYLVVGFAIGVANIVGIWLWKKWAVYLFFASAVISLAMPTFILKPLNPSVGMMTFYGSVISCGLWFWAIYRKWQFFD